jgi:hypothetical protein
MPSKYAGVLDGLQPLPPELPAYQQKIDAIKAELRQASTMLPETLAQEYAKLRAIKDNLKDDLSVVQERLTAVEQMLVESLDADEPGWGNYGATPTTVKLANGASVRVDYEPVGKVEDPDACWQWCHDNGLSRAMKLPWQTLNALVKERTLAGEPPPTGIGVFVMAKIVFKGAK